VPLLLSLAQLDATPHKIASFRRHGQVFASGSGWRLAIRAMLLIDHGFLDFDRRVQTLSHLPKKASIIRTPYLA
jgi:hypothetical protein